MTKNTNDAARSARVDILRISGDEGEQALLVNDQLVDVCPGDGEGATTLLDAGGFFEALGQAIGVQFVVEQHEIDLDALGLLDDAWEWDDVVARFVATRTLRTLRGFSHDAAWQSAVEAVVERRDAWMDGYTPDDAGETLEALNALLAAAGLPGKVWLLWEKYDDEYGPGGDSDLYYVQGSDDETVVAPAAEVYCLFDGEGNPRPFLKWLDRVRGRAGARFVCVPYFPSLVVGHYQGIDACDIAAQPACCLRCPRQATWLVNCDVYCDDHARQAAEKILAEEPVASRYHHPAGFKRVGHEYVEVEETPCQD